MPPVRLIHRLLALLVVGALAACGGDGGSSEGVTTTEEGTVPDPRASLDAPPPGEGVAVIGIEQLSFSVTGCAEGAGPDDTPQATRELLVEGEGESSDGAFVVEITRYRSDTGAARPVVTETARIVFVDDAEDGGGRGIEARRTTSGSDGGWLDLTDPQATVPLIESVDGGVDVSSRFGPAGAVAGDDGLEEGRVRASCPT